MFSLIIDILAVVIIVSVIAGFLLAYVIHLFVEERSYRKWRGFKK